MFENMFGEEKHTRESYKNAEENKDLADEEVAAARRDGISPEDDRTQKEYDKWVIQAEKRRIKARKKLDDLMASGNKEALELNKEYDRLYENFDQTLRGVFPTTDQEENLYKNPEEAHNRAQEALIDFETEKLGMWKREKTADEKLSLEKLAHQRLSKSGMLNVEGEQDDDSGEKK